MSDIDVYLRGVARGLRGMDPRLREDILRELRSHLADATNELGEARAIESAEAPDRVAARHKELYGYGRSYRALFLGIAVALSIPTLPLLLFGGAGTTAAFGASVGFLALLVAYLIWVAVRAGATVGLLAGAAACVARFVSVLALGAVAGGVVADAGGWALFAASSVMLIVVGWVPGRARERWRPRDVGL